MPKFYSYNTVSKDPIIYTLKETEDFMDIYNHIKKAVPFNECWKDVGAYYDYALRGEHAPILEVGEMAKCVVNDKSRLVFVGTPFGNGVVFECYSEIWQSPTGLLFCNMPLALQKLRYDDENKKTLLGYSIPMRAILGGKIDNEVIPNIGEFLSIQGQIKHV